MDYQNYSDAGKIPDERVDVLMALKTKSPGEITGKNMRNAMDDFTRERFMNMDDQQFLEELIRLNEGRKYTESMINGPSMLDRFKEGAQNTLNFMADKIGPGVQAASDFIAPKQKRLIEKLFGTPEQRSERLKRAELERRRNRAENILKGRYQ